MARSMSSFQLFMATFYPIRQLATGTFGEAYLAIRKHLADELRTKSYSVDTESGKSASSPWLHTQLRNHILVVKIPSEEYENTDCDLRNEIAMLTILSNSHPRLIQALDHHVDREPGQWLAMPYITGGDLFGLIESAKAERILSTPFLWHIMHGVGSALLFLHYGVQDPSPATQLDPNWTSVAHADIHGGNVFLSPAGRLPGLQSFGNFPDIILADFGKMKLVHAAAGTNVGNTEPDALHYKDLAKAGILLSQMAQLKGINYDMRREDLLFEWHNSLRFYNQDKTPTSHDVLFEMLKELVLTADTQRRIGYRPLDDNTVAWLDDDKVSYAELSLIYDRPDWTPPL